MNRILMGLAVAALTTATAAADPGGFAPPTPGGGLGFASPAGHSAGGSPDTLVGMMGAPPTRAPDRYGMLPGLRKLFHLDKGCSTCGEGNGSHRGGCPKGGCGPFGHGAYGGPGYGAAPPVNQGTLVFPQHPYVRGPRDFFMYEPGR